MRVLTGSQMYKVEQAQVDEGISFTRLMENAGAACARAIIKRFADDEEKKNVCVVCGKGKNGGDGFVIARKLAQAGYNTDVILAYGTPSADDAVIMREKMHDIKLVDEYLWDETTGKKVLNRADIIVDAIFGIGYRYAEDAYTKCIFKSINEAKGIVISIDVPSGCESDTGTLAPYCVNADMTIAISALKPVHVFKPCSYMCGETVVVDIGISESAFSAINTYHLETLNLQEAREMFPKRDIMGNKGTFGHALSICGSKNMQGAAVLAATGALRCGAGMVTAAFPEAAYSAIAPKLTEQLMLPLPSNAAGTFSSAAIPMLIERTEKSSAVLVGCGLGLNMETKELVGALVRNCEKPLIIDADGINAVSCNIDILKEAKAPALLTPHPGEMARLTGKTVNEIEADRVKAAVDFANAYNVTVLLKGASTIIAAPGSKKIYVNTTGNPGMAKGGSGDLLSGIILSLLAQGLNTFDAAVLGAYIHGAVGDRAAHRLSMAGMTPSDCAAMLGELLCEFE